MQHYFSRLEKAIKENWNSKALADFRGESFTYGQVAAEIEKFHIFLNLIGATKEDKVALCAKNSARWAVSFLSANTYGTVVVPILADFNPKSINHLTDHSESIVLVTDSEIWKKLDIKEMPRLRAVISTENFSILYAADDSIIKASDQVEKVFAQKYPGGFGPQNVEYDKDNDKKLALINYTSGTTSAPKGVMIRYESLSSNIEFAAKVLSGAPGDEIVSMLPMAHMYGMSFEFLYPVTAGVAVNYLGKAPTPTLLLAAMAKIKPFAIITVPMVLEKIFKNKILPVISKPHMKVLVHIPGIREVIFKKIRETLLTSFGGNITTIIMGGAALNPEVEKWFKRFRLPFTVGYGMTEGAPLFGYEAWEKFVPQSCGKVVDNVEVRIDSENPLKVVGEIQMRGINVMSGYYKNPEATEAAFTEDGWLRTGDLGLLDKDGNIFIKGRSKNMILTSNGQNVYPEEIEAMLNNETYVVESVVVARVNSIVGLLYLDADKLKADGYDADGISDMLDIILSKVNKQLPAYGRLSKLEIMDQPFEKTPKMSIKRFLYR